MKLENTIKRFSEHQGMKLVDFSEVALPIYRITSTILIHERVKLDTIEEFILRAVNLGFDNVERINELLGLSTEVSKEGLTQLIRSDLLIERLDGRVELTPQGVESVHEHLKVRPEEQPIIFDYDGLIRKVRLPQKDMYLTPKELKTAELLEIRAIPARKPEENEIELQQVNEYIDSYNDIDKSDKTLLRIRKITRAVRLFYKAIMLIYKEHGSGNYEAAFCIENQLSEQHALAFMKQDGLKRLGLLKNINEFNPQDIVKEYSDYVCFPDNKSPKNVKISYKNKRFTDDNSTENKVINPSIYHYSKYLSESLDNTDKSLVIVSSNLSSGIISHEFYKKISQLVKIGVTVNLGYLDNSLINDSTEWKSLIELSKFNEEFNIKKITEIKANILIKDDNFYVITNFEFLSYKGNRKKKIIDTWGNYIDDTKKVKAFYNEIINNYFS